MTTLNNATSRARIEARIAEQQRRYDAAVRADNEQAIAWCQSHRYDPIADPRPRPSEILDEMGKAGRALYRLRKALQRLDGAQ